MPPKKPKNPVVHTNYGDYVDSAACRKFIRQNRRWQQDDPIGFDLEVINRFAIDHNNYQTNPNSETEYDD